MALSDGAAIGVCLLSLELRANHARHLVPNHGLTNSIPESVVVIPAMIAIAMQSPDTAVLPLMGLYVELDIL